MMKIWLSCGMAIFLIGNLFAQEEFSKYLDIFARAGSILSTSTKGKAVDENSLSQLQQELAQLTVPNELQPEVALLQLQVLYAQEKYQEVVDFVEIQSEKYTGLMPDWFILGYFSSERLKGKREDFLSKIGELLPFSIYGINRDELKQDGQKYTSMGLGDTVPVGYGFDETDAYYMAQAFQAFRDVQGYSDSLLILIYVKPYLDKDQKHLRYDLRLTPSESLWREIGHAERQQGHEYLARIAYLRAAFETPANKQELQDEWNEKVELVASPKSVPREAAENIASLYSRGKYWPWSIDILKRAESFDQERINGQIKQFANEVAAGLRQNPAYVRWGVPATEITDFENFHLPKPSETFWNEETLYVPKETIEEVDSVSATSSDAD